MPGPCAPRRRAQTSTSWFAHYEALWGSPERALARAQRAAQRDPPCGDCFEAAAAALLRQGARKAAISSQREALRRTYAPAPYERRLAWLKVLEGATADTPASALSLPPPWACPLAPEGPSERAP